MSYTMRIDKRFFSIIKKKLNVYIVNLARLYCGPHNVQVCYGDARRTEGATRCPSNTKFTTYALLQFNYQTPSLCNIHKYEYF